jgi:hypothetical protein
MRSICLLQQLFGARVRSAEYREANNLETEIWRAGQNSNTAVDGRRAASCCCSVVRADLILKKQTVTMLRFSNVQSMT